MKKNKDIDLNNYLFNKISDIEIRLKCYLKEKENYENNICVYRDIDNKIKASYSVAYLKDNINYFKGMLKAYQEILSLLIGEDVRKL